MTQPFHSAIVGMQKGYSYEYKICQGDVVKTTYKVIPSNQGYNYVGFPVDGGWHGLFALTTYISPNGINIESLPAGSYILKIVPGGSLQFNPDNEGWQTASLPSIVSFNIEISTDKSLTVTFGSTYDVNYA